MNQRSFHQNTNNTSSLTLKNKSPTNTTTTITNNTNSNPQISQRYSRSSGIMNRIAQLGNFSAAAIHLTSPSKSTNKFAIANQY